LTWCCKATIQKRILQVEGGVCLKIQEIMPKSLFLSIGIFGSKEYENPFHGLK
jgi:hypothetical protein